MLIEAAYREGERQGLAVWGEDEAGPYQTKPYPGRSWQPEGQPARQAHEYVRNGTAKLMTLFHPASGRVRVQGVRRTPNAVLHPWLKHELEAILATLPKASDGPGERADWRRWQAGLRQPITLPEHLPPLRLLLVLDNLTGHTTSAFVLWLFAHGILPLYTPLSGSWLNLTESVQRILVQRALAGQHPDTPQAIIDGLEQAATAWNRDPTPFAWGGKRAARRQRARERRHRLGGSGAYARRPLRRSRTLLAQWQQAMQTTH
jgi:DDE superfamily endonuclease